jgi:hypothetical protein
MIQGLYYHKQLLEEPTTMPAAISTSYQNKAVISLDNMPIGYVTREENNNMIITDDTYRNRFLIPSCKVISVDKRNTNSLIVDIGYDEAVKYRIVE